ncbi:BKACE family enzyme [Curvivirga aplysinae]|uniref:3-keto-5-aminohexanoate cleavage protein n=1 Tax=Curvivirga aplysinae TaxID=2529852 RepID=UPI0012BB9CFF|nr:3-keto-5-aminohexanoate cleavage protein [Curvivirga aplysinae]MTI10683.1 3-keto-5-aminohexanoate cleavage protein [Curvivirga aplysinae]
MTNTKTILCVAPNGARKTKSDHQSLPITPDELAKEAAACQAAGAAMIHLHVRDEDDKHTILPEYYRPAIEAVRNRVGNKMVIQITTEAVGVFTVDQQISAVKELKPEAVSLALKELCPEGGEEKAASFFKWVLDEKIAAQYILYSAEEVKRFIMLHNQGIIPDPKPSILLVLGRYSANLTSNPGDLFPMLDALGEFNCVWAVCAFGPQEQDCMAAAVERGGHCRIGFENNMHQANGELAANNAALIQDFANRINKNGGSVASAAETRAIFKM